MSYNKNFVFLRENLKREDVRVVALQGGTRSAKTYSALQYIVALCYAYRGCGMVISIVRGSYPALAATVLRDFKDILKSAGIYDEENESKPSGYYEYDLYGNFVEFFSVDNEQKVRGRKRDILFINEANEITLDKFRQLAFRTTGRIIIDYNPSDGDGYIREHILTRKDCALIVTTYKDNDFLSKEIVAEIELIKDADPEYWNVFGLGLWGNVEGAVLGHHKVVDHLTVKRNGPKAYGLDFGYSAPSAFVEANFYDESIYLVELLYERKLTNTELIKRIKKLVPLNALIYADAAEPDRIQEFRDAGFTNIHPAIKSIKDGLDKMRSMKLYVSDVSTNWINEAKQYRYIKNKHTGELQEDPVAIAGDHAIDASRYAVYSYFKRITPGGKATTAKPNKNRIR